LNADACLEPEEMMMDGLAAIDHQVVRKVVGHERPGHVSRIVDRLRRLEQAVTRIHRGHLPGLTNPDDLATAITRAAAARQRASE
jgi:hypothetical protein